MTRTFSPEAVRRRATQGRVAHGVACVVGAGIITAVLANQAASYAGFGEAAVLARCAVVEVLAAMVGAALVVLNVRTLRATDTSARRSYRRAAAVTLACAVAVVLALVAIALAGSGEADTILFALLAAIMPAYVLLLAGATASAAWARMP